jgi:phospholipase C
MTKSGRREFLRVVSSGALAAAALPLSIQKALAIPAHHEKGSIEDVKHIILMV